MFGDGPSPDPRLAAAAERLGGVQRCDGQRWRWDGVTFRLLRVERPAYPVDNDRSCILLVDDGRHRTLLAGDVGAAVEGRLLRVLLAAGALLSVSTTSSRD